MTRKFRFLAIFFLILAQSAVAQFSDDFLTPSLELDEMWQGTRAKFRIEMVDATQNRLQLFDTTAIAGTNRAYLSTPSEAMENAEWKIDLELGTTLSSSNYVRFYLAANESDLTAPLDGYFVWIGNTQKEISLYRQNGTKNTKIIDGIDGRAAGNGKISVQITRQYGQWTLSSRTTGESDFTNEGTATDNAIRASKFAGFSIVYSKTNGQNYAVSSIFGSGEAINPTFQNVKKYDLIFTEIMADPDPQVALPNAEFLEIYNRTEHAIDLTDWKLRLNGNKIGTIENGTIAAGEYATLVPNADAELFAEFRNIVAVTSWPTLTNSGALIELVDNQNRTIAWTEYSDRWFGDSGFKRDGGWSLERNGNDYLDNHAENWQPTTDSRGGTPSEPNATAENLLDWHNPRLNSVAITADTTTLNFSKSMNENELENKDNYLMDLELDTIQILQPQARTAKIVLKKALEIGEKFELILKNLHDIDGNELGEKTVEIALPESPEIGDVVLNEILFNPFGDGVDFVELYNISDKHIDLSKLLITKRKNGELDSRIVLCSEPRLLSSHSFVTLTTDPDLVCMQYECSENAHFEVVKLPSLPDTEGNIVIALADGSIIDELDYDEKMHHSFVTDREGVSLERVNPFAATNSRDNWQSASHEVGYATPCRQNSQYFVPNSDENEVEKFFWLEHSSFSPNNDGYRDLCVLNYRLPGDGFAATIEIFTPTGQSVRHLLRGELLSTEGYLTWNGRNDRDQLCEVGIYVVVIEAIRTDGEKIQQKIVTVISD